MSDAGELKARRLPVGVASLHPSHEPDGSPPQCQVCMVIAGEPSAGEPCIFAEMVADELDVFMADVRNELARAELKYPDGDIYYRLAALTGEVGELAQGVAKERPHLELRAEAVQVAVCAYRAARVLMAGGRPVKPNPTRSHVDEAGTSGPAQAEPAPLSIELEPRPICPQCGAPVKDGGVWLDRSPRVAYDAPPAVTDDELVILELLRRVWRTTERPRAVAQGDGDPGDGRLAR